MSPTRHWSLRQTDPVTLASNAPPSLMTDLTISSSRAPSHRLCAAGESLIDSTSPSSDLRWPSQGRDPSNTWPEEQGSPGDRCPPLKPRKSCPLCIFHANLGVAGARCRREIGSFRNAAEVLQHRGQPFWASEGQCTGGRHTRCAGPPSRLQRL